MNPSTNQEKQMVGKVAWNSALSWHETLHSSSRLKALQQSHNGGTDNTCLLCRCLLVALPVCIYPQKGPEIMSVPSQLSHPPSLKEASWGASDQ